MFRRICLVAIIPLLLASLLANAWLFQKNTEYYHAMNRIRLDPLGLQAYAKATEQASEESTVVFFGDSRAQDWPAPTDLPNVHFINRGIGAQTSAQVVGRYAMDVHALQPNVIVLQVGINDLKTIALFPQDKDKIIADCIANIHQIIAEAQRDQATVIVTTIFPTRAPSLERRVYWSDDIAPAILEVNAAILAMQQ